MLKFLLTPPHLLKEEETAIFTTKITKKSTAVSQECNKSSKKFTVTGKRFKTFINKTDNFKRKLEFSQNAFVVQSYPMENDSESLFFDTNAKKQQSDVPKAEIRTSYLDLQNSINDTRSSPDVKSVANPRKATKRKLSKNNIVDDTEPDKRSPKTRKINAIPELTVCLEKLVSPFKLPRRRRSMTSSSPSSLSSPSSTLSSDVLLKNSEGTFIGFSDAQISDSYYRLQTAIKCFDYLKSLEKEVPSNIAPVFSNLSDFNSVDFLCRTGCTDSLEKVKDTSRSRSKCLQNKSYRSEQRKGKRDGVKKSVSSPAKVEQQKLIESNANNRIKVDIIDDKQELVKAHQEWRKEKENSILSLPDPELEEVVDVNAWHDNEKVLRKKKSLLFKSVKERNRRSLLFDGGTNLHLSDDNAKSTYLQEPVIITQSEENNNSVVDSRKKFLFDEVSAHEKEEIPPSGDSKVASQLCDFKVELLLTKIVSDLSKSSSDLPDQQNEKLATPVEPCASQIGSFKPDDKLSKMNEEHENLFSKISNLEDKQNVSTETYPVPSTSSSTFKILIPKIDDNVALETSSGLLAKSATDEDIPPISIATESENAEIISASKVEENKNVEHPPVSDDLKNVHTPIDLISASGVVNEIYVISPNNCSRLTSVKYESSSSSVELIEKSDEPSVVTISDTTTNDDEDKAKEFMAVVPSQPVSISSISTENPVLAPSESKQTAAPCKATYVNTISSGESESSEKDHNLFVNTAPTKLKCAKLKKAINDQNEKMLVNIRTSFSRISPRTLAVEKCKGQKITASNVVSELSAKQDRSGGNVVLSGKTKDSLENLVADEVKIPVKSFSSLPKSDGLPDEMLTEPASPRSRSVACQTTSDLHVALLAQEFPHLFKQQNAGFSVFYTPGESTLTEPGAFCNLKTPRVQDTARPTNFTSISSVTSSEKKIYENMFADRSVLGDSTFHCPTTGDKTVDDISIQPLPSTGKKAVSFSSTSAGDKRKLSVRLTFESDVEKPTVLDSSLCTASSTPLSRTDSTYCSGLKTVLREAEIDGVEVEKSISKPNESSEIEFADSTPKDSVIDGVPLKEVTGVQDGVIGPCDNGVPDSNVNMDTCNMVPSTLRTSPKADVIRLDLNLGGYSTPHDIGVPDCNVNMDTCSVVQSTLRASLKADLIPLDSNMRGYSAESPVNDDGLGGGITPNPEDAVVDDDDDVDFIAGTPTSYSKRCVNDNLEKLLTQSFSLKNSFSEDFVPAAEKSDQTLFDSAGSRSQMSQSLIDCSRPLPGPPIHDSSEVVFQKDAKQSSPVPKGPPSEKYVSGQKSSLDLFNSTAASLVDVTPSLSVVTTGLKDDDVKVVKLFCHRFSVLLVDRISDKTTHLVVKTDQKNRTARTFKYLQAIVSSVHIISVEWVRACLDANQILDEEKFVPFDSSGECGPLRAYNSRKGLTPSPLSWLRDYCVFFTEPVPPACTLLQLHDIVGKTGAVVITTLNDFKKYPALHHLIIVSDEDESSQTSNTDIANWLQIYQAVAVEFNWFLEVIGRNRLVPFAEYELVEIPCNLLLKLNFPNVMLQYEKEDAEDSD